MIFDFDLPGTPPRPARLMSGMLGGFKLLVEGKEVKRATTPGKPFLVPKVGTTGSTRVEVKTGGLDFIPKVSVDGKPLVIAPPLPGWQQGVALLPFAMVFFGGAIGGALGAAAAMINIQIFHKKADLGLKLVLTTVVTAGAVVVYVVIAGLVQGAIRR